MNWELIIDASLTTGFGPQAVVFALAAVGLNIHFGYTGLVNFGQVAFVAVGAYTVAMGVVTFGLSVWLCIFLVLVTTSVLAMLLGLPTLRLRADYLAIVTIASGEIFRLVMRAGSYRDVTGGAAGIQEGFGRDFYALNPFKGDSYGVRIPFTDIDISYRGPDMWILVVGWSLVALFCLFTYLAMRSPWGRVIKAIREDEDAVRSLGKNVYVYKLQALALGGLMGGFAGVIFGLDRQSVAPDSLGTQFTFACYVVLVLGGAARVIGPVLGAIVFWTLRAFVDITLRQAITHDVLGISNVLVANEVGIVVQILIGVGLMALMIFRPQGIIGDKTEIAVSVRR